MKSPIWNALLAALYIICLVSAIFYGGPMLGGQEETILIPITMLSLFVLSASIMGFLFLSQPLQLYFDGAKREAVRFFLKTALTFAAITAVFMLGTVFVPRIAPGVFVHPSDVKRSMSVEAYVTQNISELSPIKEQLGGTFYVTKIEAHGGAGTVEYEDGHNAYVADFRYETDERGAVTVSSFSIRE
jgi:hypothetical protein